jgi:hypothetical protein
MDTNAQLYNLLIGFAIAITGVVVYYWITTRNQKKESPATANTQSHSLQLQAYERLTLLTDRIALPNLIARIPKEGLLVADFQLLLLKNIRDEFDYNITQQIYVTPESWQAVKKLKEKNMLIINQIAQSMPPGSSALDFSRSILNFCMHDEKGNLHDLVSEALSYEASKLM